MKNDNIINMKNEKELLLSIEVDGFDVDKLEFDSNEHFTSDDYYEWLKDVYIYKPALEVIINEKDLLFDSLEPNDIGLYGEDFEINILDKDVYLVRFNYNENYDVRVEVRAEDFDGDNFEYSLFDYIEFIDITDDYVDIESTTVLMTGNFDLDKI